MVIIAWFDHHNEQFKVRTIDVVDEGNTFVSNYQNANQLLLLVYFDVRSNANGEILFCVALSF